MAPRGAAGKEVTIDGTPPGWKCVEKMYMSGGMAGKTYLRFQNDKHKNVLSLKAAIELHARDSGIDPAEAVRDYERKKEEKREELAKLREERGLLKGEKRAEAMEHFRSVHGKLDGATITALPGWRGESKLLENCGQISATYYDPEGRVFKLINDIEAFLGTKLMNGEEIPDIEKARGSVVYDEKGRPLNVARHGENLQDLEAQAKKRRLSQQAAGAELYREAPGLSVVRLHGGAGAGGAAAGPGLEGREDLRQAAAEVQRLLLGRGLRQETGVLAVLGGEGAGAAPRAVAGLYYEMAEAFNDRPCYQRVLPCPGRSGVLACRGQYIFWSTTRDSWKIGPLDDSKIGFAVCAEDAPVPTAMGKPWSVLKPPSGNES